MLGMKFSLARQRSQQFYYTVISENMSLNVMTMTFGLEKWLFRKHLSFCFHFIFDSPLKGIVHFEIDFWYVLAYLKGIQDPSVFVSAVCSILIFLGQILSEDLWGPPWVHLKEHAQRSPN